MKQLRHSILGTAATAVAFACSLPAVAQQSSTSPAVMTKELGTNMTAEVVTAVVTAIDQKNRIVTFKGPEGNEFSVVADASVKNLPQVKVGDTLALKYFKAVAVSFAKGDGIRMATSIDASETAKKGQMPGAGAFTRVNTVSNIWAINQAKGTVLVRGPYGHFIEVTLKDPNQLAGVKVGDQMQVTFTQAVAVSMERAQ